jgi:hypothetical protein
MGLVGCRVNIRLEVYRIWRHCRVSRHRLQFNTDEIGAGDLHAVLNNRSTDEEFVRIGRIAGRGQQRDQPPTRELWRKLQGSVCRT